MKNKISIKILCVIPGRNTGNSMMFAREECKKLSSNFPNIVEHFFNIHKFRNTVKAIIDLEICIKKIKPDIVHAHFGSLTAFVCSLLSKSLFIITFRGSDLNPSPSDGFFRSAIQKILSQLAALRANRIICVSQNLKKRLWWRKNITEVITTGVDTSIFKTIPQRDARKLLNIPLKNKIVLFTGGGVPRVKRLDLAKQSIEHVKNEMEGVDFLVLDGNVPYASMPLYYNAADCFLFTSDYEGSPCVIQEAIACNLPIVSVDVGDVKLLLEKVVPSRITERNPLSLGDSVIEILKYGRRSNGKVMLGILSKDIIIHQLTSVYESMYYGN